VNNAASANAVTPGSLRRLGAALLAPSLAGLMLAPLSGCEESTMVTRGAFDHGGPQALATAPVIAGIELYKSDGPRVAFDNQTSKTMEVRWWIGRVDMTDPSGFSDLRTGQHLGAVVPPGKKIARRTQRQPWPTGTVDAVVRLEVRERLADGTLGEVKWLELPRPGSYLLRAKEVDGAVVFDRPRGNGEVVALPLEGTPTGRNGDFPVYADRVSMSGN
jgi:hypothetical protein